MSDGLVWAIKNGDIDQVKELVEKKVGTNKGEIGFEFICR